MNALSMIELGHGDKPMSTPSKKPTQIADTRFTIIAGHPEGEDKEAIERRAYGLEKTLQRISALPCIESFFPIKWKVKTEVSIQVNQMKDYAGIDLHGATPVFRPVLPTISDIRQFEEERGNPGWWVMGDADIRGFDKFPSVNGESIINEPKPFAQSLAASFSQIAHTFSKDMPQMFGWSTTEGDTGFPGINGFEDTRPEKLLFAMMQLVVIKKGAPGTYPTGWNMLEDVHRVISCYTKAGGGSIARSRLYRLRAGFSKTNKDFSRLPEWQDHHAEMKANFGEVTVKKVLSGRTRHNAKKEGKN